MMLRLFLIAGLCAFSLFFVVCVYGSSLDWHELQLSDLAFRAASQSAELKTLFVLARGKTCIASICSRMSCGRCLAQ